MLELMKTFATATLLVMTPGQDAQAADMPTWNTQQSEESQMTSPTDDSDQTVVVRARSGDDVIEDICEAAQAILKADAVIEKQKKIGKVSGFVDKVAMQHAGEIIVRRKAELKSLDSEYKTLTGKTYNRKLMLTKCEL